MGFESQEGLSSIPGLAPQDLCHFGQVASPAQSLVSSSVNGIVGIKGQHAKVPTSGPGA